jgi:short subunit dehydrogenase-like uncharacterized protein
MTQDSALKTVLVLGATGYTGQMVVAELARLGQPFIIAGRNREKLETLRKTLDLGQDGEIRIGDPTRPDSLSGLFEAKGPPVGVVINCVGPFTQLGEPVVRTAVEAGVHYLDITGEQAYLARIVALFDSLAQQKGCAVIPACGVEYALGNWAATLAAENLEPLDELWTATAIEKIRASRGTQLSLFEALSQPGLGWQGGQRKLKMTATSARRVEFPPPFGTRRAVWAPFGELVTIPRHIRVRNMNSYMSLPAPLALTLQATSPLLPLVSRLLGKGLAKPLAKNPQPDYTEKSRWALVAESQGAKGKRRVVLQGAHVYQLTANILGWCAGKMLEPDFTARGVLGPAQVFDPRTALDYLKDFGVDYTIT